MRGAAAVRRLRPPAERPAAGRLQGTLAEPERQADGSVAQTLTVFLTGAECPFTCVFCDLWRHTHDGATPPGAIVAQLRRALATAPPEVEVVKLYNASNLFDPRAVPEADDPALRDLVAGFGRVVVESHPRLVGDRADRWAAALPGRLEVAMGLETSDPRAFPRLGKGAVLADYRRAAGRLRAAGATVRCFLLVGVPFVPPAEQVASLAASVRFAAELGARHVTLIPVRGGNGALEALAATGDFMPPTLRLLEACLAAALAVAGGDVVVTADLWDLERLTACPACFAARHARLVRANLTGRLEPAVACAAGCGAGVG